MKKLTNQSVTLRNAQSVDYTDAMSVVVDLHTRRRFHLQQIIWMCPTKQSVTAVRNPLLTSLEGDMKIVLLTSMFLQKTGIPFTSKLISSAQLTKEYVTSSPAWSQVGHYRYHVMFQKLT